MLAIGFIRQFQWVYRDSETFEGRSCRFQAAISCFSEDFMYCFVYMYMFISEWKRSVVHTWICLSKEIRPLAVFIYLMDFTGQGGGARVNSKVHEKSSLITIYFHRQVYIILQTVPVCNPYAQINLPSGEGKTDRKSRTATMDGNFRHRTSLSRRNKPRSPLCSHWSERSVSIL